MRTFLIYTLVGTVGCVMTLFSVYIIAKMQMLGWLSILTDFQKDNKVIIIQVPKK